MVGMVPYNGRRDETMRPIVRKKRSKMERVKVFKHLKLKDGSK